MRNANTVLDIIQDRGKRGLPLEDVYRQLYDPDLYLHAYGKIYANDGAMTPGSTGETVWFIEGDIKGCFDNIDHQVLLSILRETIHDNRFIRLIEGLLKAGYVEDWKYNPTLSGSPQGGIVSPVLSNIYLDKLDQFVEHDLLPRYHRGQKRKKHWPYGALQVQMFRKKKAGGVVA